MEPYKLLLAVMVSQTFLIFYDLDSFGSANHTFYRICLNLGISFRYMVRPWLWILRSKVTKLKRIFHST